MTHFVIFNHGQIIFFVTANFWRTLNHDSSRVRHDSSRHRDDSSRDESRHFRTNAQLTMSIAITHAAAILKLVQ